MTTFTETQQDANWTNLDQTQRNYFNNLAANDPVRTGQAFFESEVPVDLQDKPELLETYLNGGTVDVPVEVHYQGRAGSTWETAEYEVSDKDWSHDVSDKNGGSGSADNGRFEDASTNRARGSANSTPGEQAAADSASEEDVENLLSSVEEVGEAAAWGAAADVAGGFFEATLDGLLPLAGTAVAAKKVYDHFDDPTDKVGFGALAGGGAALFFASPLGAPAVGCFVAWKLAERGYKLYEKHCS